MLETAKVESGQRKVHHSGARTGLSAGADGLKDNARSKAGMAA